MTSKAALRARYRNAAPTDEGPWNAVFSALLAHRSVRAYLPDALPEGLIERVVAAAQSAATSSNMQTWSVVAVADAGRKARLAAVAGGQKHIEQAPMMLVWIADLSRHRALGQAANAQVDGLDYFESFLVAAMDAALAAQNAVVALESLGLGTCYIGALRNDPQRVAQELALPREAFALFGMTIGYPDPAGASDIKPRLPQPPVLHREQYAAATPEAFAAYDREMKEFQQEQKMQPVGWTDTARARFRNAAALNGRDRLLGQLRQMGFGLK